MEPISNWTIFHTSFYIPRLSSTLYFFCARLPDWSFVKFSGSCYRTWQSIGAPVLTSLRSLQLMVPCFAENFLDNLIAPHLEEFSLLKYCDASMKEITISLLRRSACSMRSFSDLQHLPTILWRFLQSMPSLSALSITSITTLRSRGTIPGIYDVRNILQLMAKVLSSQSSSFQQGFLPNLKILDYTGELRLRPGNYGDLYSLPPSDNAVHSPT